MLKRTIFLSSATGMLLAGFLSFPAIADITVDAQRLLALSGFEDQLESLPAAVSAGFDQLLVASGGVPAPFEREDVHALQSAVSTVFSVSILREAVMAELLATLSNEDMLELTGFYLSERGKALRQAELDNTILENAERFQNWYDDVGMYNLAIERQQAIHELERAMQSTVAAVDAMIGMQVAMHVSLMPVMPTEQQVSASQVLAQARTQVDELTELYRQGSLETLAFIFKDQTVDAINDYSSALKTAAGQRYVRAINDGLNRGLFSAAEQLGLSIQGIVQQRIGQGA